MAAAFLLDQYLNKRLENLAQQVAGQEREALIEFVRSVDLYAYFLHFFPTSELTPEFAARCVAIQHGIGPILCALLPQLDKYGDGIPLFPSEKRNADWADRGGTAKLVNGLSDISASMGGASSPQTGAERDEKTPP